MKPISIVSLVVLIVVGGIFFWRNQNASPLTPSPAPSTLKASSSPTGNNFVQSSPDTNALKMGGSSYSDPQGLYTFLYPNDFTLDTQDPKAIRIYKRGESQRPQSEMSDGVLVVFESIDLQNKMLAEAVDDHIKQSTADGTSEVIQSKKSTLLNNYPGFTYELRGLGNAFYLTIQKDAQSKNALRITYSISDPKQQNYQKEVDAILSTLELRK